MGLSGPIPENVPRRSLLGGLGSSPPYISMSRSACLALALAAPSILAGPVVILANARPPLAPEGDLGRAFDFGGGAVGIFPTTGLALLGGDGLESWAGAEVAILGASSSPARVVAAGEVDLSEEGDSLPNGTELLRATFDMAEGERGDEGRARGRLDETPGYAVGDRE